MATQPKSVTPAAPPPPPPAAITNPARLLIPQGNRSNISGVRALLINQQGAAPSGGM